jgi:hypothetical protein
MEAIIFNKIKFLNLINNSIKMFKILIKIKITIKFNRMEIEISIELKINIKIKDNKLFSRISKFKEAIMQIRLLSLNKDKSKVFKIQIIKKNK